jgi:epoxyqueuosine reductase
VEGEGRDLAMKTTVLSKKIRELARATGIDVLGFAKASEFQGYALKHSRRRDPRISLPEAKTLVVGGIYLGGFTLPSWDNPAVGRTSRLFLSGFFLDVVKPLEPIAALLREEGHAALICDGSGSESSILPLKLAAIRAGLGWQGKHSLLISKKFGTFLALGGIVTSASLPLDAREETDRCGRCSKCQQACPLMALEQPYVLNKERCLSYLLQQEDLPETARAVMGNRVIDCEICQQACPWNTKHMGKPLITATGTSFQREIPGWEEFFSLIRLARLTEQEYGESLDRLKTGIPYPLFHRNVLVALEGRRPR